MRSGTKGGERTYEDRLGKDRVCATAAARSGRRTLDVNSPRAYWTYLRVYPRGPHVADARRRLTILSVALEPPPEFPLPRKFVDPARR